MSILLPIVHHFNEDGIISNYKPFANPLIMKAGWMVEFGDPRAAEVAALAFELSSASLECIEEIKQMDNPPPNLHVLPKLAYDFKGEISPEVELIATKYILSKLYKWWVSPVLEVNLKNFDFNNRAFFMNAAINELTEACHTLSRKVNSFEHNQDRFDESFKFCIRTFLVNQVVYSLRRFRAVPKIIHDTWKQVDMQYEDVIAALDFMATLEVDKAEKVEDQLSHMKLTLPNGDVIDLGMTKQDRHDLMNTIVTSSNRPSPTAIIRHAQFHDHGENELAEMIAKQRIMKAQLKALDYAYREEFKEAAWIDRTVRNVKRVPEQTELYLASAGGRVPVPVEGPLKDAYTTIADTLGESLKATLSALFEKSFPDFDRQAVQIQYLELLCAIDDLDAEIEEQKEYLEKLKIEEGDGTNDPDDRDCPAYVATIHDQMTGKKERRFREYALSVGDVDLATGRRVRRDA